MGEYRSTLSKLGFDKHEAHATAKELTVCATPAYLVDAYQKALSSRWLKFARQYLAILRIRASGSGSS